MITKLQMLAATTTCVLAACGGGGSSTPRNPASHASSQAIFEPRLKVGATLQLTATVYDPAGALVPNPTLEWSSALPDMVEVGGSGLVAG